MTIKDGATTGPSARFVSDGGGCFGHGASDGIKLEARGTPSATSVTQLERRLLVLSGPSSATYTPGPMAGNRGLRVELRPPGVPRDRRPG